MKFPKVHILENTILGLGLMNLLVGGRYGSQAISAIHQVAEDGRKISAANVAMHKAATFGEQMYFASRMADDASHQTQAVDDIVRNGSITLEFLAAGSLGVCMGARGLRRQDVKEAQAKQVAR